MSRPIRAPGALAVLAAAWFGSSGPAPAQDAPAPPREKETAGEENSRIRRGLQIAPVPLELRHKNRALVGLGSYLVNATGGCNDCHTNPPFAPGGNPFLGEPKAINAENYLAGGADFGIAVSPNITPDAEGKPGGLTFEQFEQVMRTGVDAEDGHTLQVMPWPVYQDMIRRDLRAIYEYLSAIPHAEPAP